MGNMSYCRFRNTLKDLRDCKHAINHQEDVEGAEESARDELIKMCVELAAPTLYDAAERWTSSEKELRILRSFIESALRGAK